MGRDRGWESALAEALGKIDEVLDQLARRQKARQVGTTPVEAGAPASPAFSDNAATRGRIPGRPIEIGPGREKVPTPEAAEGRPPGGSPTADPRIEAYLIAAAAVQLSGRTFRSAPDLREMLREETARQMAAGRYEFIDALEEAKRRLVADIRAGAR